MAFHRYSDEDEFKDNIKFIKADIEILNVVAARLQIRALPTFISFKDGQKANELVGANPNVLLSHLRQINA